MPDIASRSAEQTREALRQLLAEPDATRPLDSLECLVVLAFLERNGVVVGRAELHTYPVSIDGWVDWLSRTGTSGVVA